MSKNKLVLLLSELMPSNGLNQILMFDQLVVQKSGKHRGHGEKAIL